MKARRKSLAKAQAGARREGAPTVKPGDRFMGAVLRHAREARGYSTQESAMLVGVAQPTYFEWEKSDAPRSEDTLIRVAKAYGVQPLDLVHAWEKAESEKSTEPE